MSEATELGGRLKTARSTLGITQEDAAQALGVPRTAIVSIESGARRISATELDQLANLYQRSVNWFLGREDDEEMESSAIYRVAAGLSQDDRDLILEFAKTLQRRSGFNAQKASGRRD